MLPSKSGTIATVTNGGLGIALSTLSTEVTILSERVSRGLQEFVDMFF